MIFPQLVLPEVIQCISLTRIQQIAVGDEAQSFFLHHVGLILRQKVGSRHFHVCSVAKRSDTTVHECDVGRIRVAKVDVWEIV